MTWVYWLIAALILTVVLLAAAFLLTRWMQRREPYRSVLKLRTRQKLRLFKALATDRRVPKLVRVMPLFLALYLALPFDLVPDFIPVLGYLDDVAVVVLMLALMVRFTPDLVIEDHVAQLETASNSGGGPP